MIEVMKNFVREEDGISTVEIVVIISVLIGVALIFKNSIINFVNEAFDKVFDLGSDAVDEETYKPRKFN